MRLSVKGPFEADRQAQVLVPAGATLGQLVGVHRTHVRACQVNGSFLEDWSAYTPAPQDTVVLYTAPQEPISLTAILTAVITAVIGAAISLALSFIMRALAPTQSRTEGKPEAVYGVAGLTNTTAQGTPKLLCYGRRRVYGHILSTRVAVEGDGARMSFAVLYFMGEGPIESISWAQINDIDAARFGGVTIQGRLGGDDNAELIPEFPTLSQVWSDGRQLAPGGTVDEDSLVYQTRSTRTTRATVILSAPFMRTDGDDPGAYNFVLSIGTASSGTYTIFQGVPWNDYSISPRFKTIPVVFPHADQWLIRIFCSGTTNAQEAMPTLYNVMEEQDGDSRYPHCALMAIAGMASSELTSFDAMRGSAMVSGRRVKCWTGSSFETRWTDQRAWVIRDLLTDPRVGLGPWIPESFFNDEAALVAQQYWDETVTGGIRRDACHILVNDRRPAWDWLKMLLSEGRAALIPSQGQLKLVVDGPAGAALLYSMPGNMVPDTLTQTLGSGDGLLPNTIMLQFPDEADHFQPHLITYRAEGTEADTQREASAVTLYSLTRFEHAHWLARYQLLRARLVQRNFTWQSPMTALVSEPMDHAVLSYETPDYARGASGFLGADSTTLRLVLDRLVTLQEGATYTILVRHQATNAIEQRPLSMDPQAGSWGAIVLESPLDTAPAVGDLWALGILGQTLKRVVIEQVDQREQGTYQLSASEYRAELYLTPQTPPPPIDPPEPPAPPGPASPSAVQLEGTFGGSGTISLSWTQAVLGPGDTLEKYWVKFSEFDQEHWQDWGFAFEEHFEQLVSELRSGYFGVFAEATLGGYGPLSNTVYTDWQYAG